MSHECKIHFLIIVCAFAVSPVCIVTLFYTLLCLLTSNWVYVAGIAVIQEYAVCGVTVLSSSCHCMPLVPVNTGLLRFALLLVFIFKENHWAILRFTEKTSLLNPQQKGSDLLSLGNTWRSRILDTSSASFSQVNYSWGCLFFWLAETVKSKSWQLSEIQAHRKYYNKSAPSRRLLLFKWWTADKPYIKVIT